MMRRVQRFVFVTAALLSVLACQQQTEGGAGAATAELTSDDQKTVYALGLALAREIEPFRLDESELDLLARGMKDGALGRPPQVELEAQMPKIQELGRARVAAAATEEAAAAEAFVAAAAAEPGAEKLESGLVYREITPGTGASPTPDDIVKVHYHGTLRDGTVFDSSVERGSPAEFPLKGVIPCWTEGVQKMKVGGKARLVCPASTAYGDRGAPPRIKPGAAIAFDVELLEIGAKPATD
ncbi:MAG: FKBP-type peptidyl-prolyl cis-trans isomerase [Myxococcota bacterium]